jgi:hypothetical protein
MSNWRIERRRFITGVGAIFTLPLLESLHAKTAWAAADGDPRRFVSLYMPNGTYNLKGDAVWYPPVGPLGNNLPRVLSPFAANIADFSVLMHPDSRARNQSPVGAHATAASTYLTQRLATDYGSSQCTVPGDSFDQMVANAAKKPNLVISGGCNSGAPDNTPFNYAEYLSYKNGQPNEPYRNPVSLYKQMFANLVPTTTSAPVATAAAARNKSILDNSLADIKDLQSHLGKNDNVKLDSYFSSVRALETKLAGAGAAAPASGCTAGKSPSPTLDNVDINGNLSAVYIARMQAFCDMITLGFQCDLFRSVSLTYDGEGAQRRNNPCPPDLNLNNSDLSGVLHTGISHYGQNGPGGADRAVSRDRTYMSIFVYLLNGLKAVKDPSGSTILDNTLVLSGFGVPDGQHNNDDAEGVPMVLGGGRNFARPGNCIDLGGADMTDLFYTFNTYLKLGLPNFEGSTNVLKV